MWTIELELVKDWLNSLDRESKIQVLAALEILKEQGPNLKRPLVGKINASCQVDEGASPWFCRTE